jgi:hypothetical protein
VLYTSREFPSRVLVSREYFCLERSHSSRNASLHSSCLVCPECRPRIKSCGTERARAVVVLDSDFDGLGLSRRQLLKGRTHCRASGMNGWYEQKTPSAVAIGDGHGVLAVFEIIESCESVEVGFPQNLAENSESLNVLDMSRTFSVSSRCLVCITGASGPGPVGLNPGYGSILLGGFLSIRTREFTRLWTGICPARVVRRLGALRALQSFPAAPNCYGHPHTL